ncbi:MAG: saccharopine dehydrogenase family protein [Planctomycetota bacterium]|jgi:saccharopine dehydrogenase (NAD+, L-lysine-forming)
MNPVLIIGTGGVGSVVVKKCHSIPEVFGPIHLASRTVSKCEAIRAEIGDASITCDAVDADHASEVAALIRKYNPKLVINTALPYQDLAIMDACLETGVDYLDTANYEPKDEAKFCYQWQWDYQERFKERGIMALLGSGFDPGVTNVFCAHAKKHHFDEMHYVDIMDANGGDHGQPFATNFNPEINIREITQRGKFWEEGEWRSTAPLSEHKPFNFPGIGEREMYLMYHEEMESLVKHLPGLKRIRFWMTFGAEYLTHLRVLQNVGMTRIDPVVHNGVEVIPLQFLKSVLPDPGSLGETTKGKTCIGCMIDGVKGGVRKKRYIYNICDHEACYAEVGSQAISYTTGVPAMIGAKMMLTGAWRGEGVFNMEEFDPDPFMADLNTYGLPWVDVEQHVDR